MSGLRGPVALLSLWTRNDFLDQLGEPAYQAAVLEDSLAAAAAAGGSRLFGGSFDPGNTLADDATLDELPSAAAAVQCLQALEDLASSGVIGGLVVLAVTPATLPLGLRAPSVMGPLARVLGTVAPLWEPALGAAETQTRLLDLVGDRPGASGMDHGVAVDLMRPELAAETTVVLNLNKLRAAAQYQPGDADAAAGSGRDAYGKYGAPLAMLRRGTYPIYYGRRPRCVLRVANAAGSGVGSVEWCVSCAPSGVAARRVRPSPPPLASATARRPPVPFPATPPSVAPPSVAPLPGTT